MNRLATEHNGGMPLFGDDFRWFENGLKIALKGGMSFLGDNFILSGCGIVNLGGNNRKVAQGYVVLDGEIYYVPESDSYDITATPIPHFVPTITYDADGLQTFENNVAYNKYEIRQAPVTAYASFQAAPKVPYNLVDTAEEIINDMLGGYAHTFTKRQSWAKGDATAVNAGANAINFTVDSGNGFLCNIDNANTDVIRIIGDFPSGTWLWVKFTGSAGKVVNIGDGTGQTRPIITPGAKTYQYRAGESALLWVEGTNYHLYNPIREKSDWKVFGQPGAPAFTNSWNTTNPGGGQPATPAAYRLEDGLFELKGKIAHTGYSLGNKVFANVGFTTTHKRVIPCISADGAEELYNVVLYPNGDLAVEHSTASGTVYLYLDAFRIRLF